MIEINISNFRGSILSSRSLRIALVAGASLAGAVFAYHYCRRSNVVQDITETSQSAGDPRQQRKNRLKLLLSRKNVHCSDFDYVEEIIDNLILSGPEQLQVIADFDRTMTPLTYQNKHVPSTHGVIESCPHLPDWFIDEVDKTRAYYQSIEFDPSLTKEEKIPFMEEWWHKAQEKLISASLKRDDLAEGVRCSNLYLREKSDALLELLHKNDIPLLVFSAGVGDVIRQAFIQRYTLYSNIHIIANWMQFNHEGILIGFKGETIHTFNKNTHALHNASYFGSLRHRHNIILLGDSLGDLDIADGLIKHENLLTIGYLNQNVDASLSEYKDRFDIVLTEEDGVELLQALLENITTL